MQLWQFIKFMFGLTMLALIYIYLQMNIFSLSYEGKKREKHIVRLREQNGRVSSNIFEMKSASYLGPMIFKEDPELKFGGDQNIVKLVTARNPSSHQNTASNHHEKTIFLSKLFPWHFPTIAHAEEHKSRKPWERKSNFD